MYFNSTSLSAPPAAMLATGVNFSNEKCIFFSIEEKLKIWHLHCAGILTVVTSINFQGKGEVRTYWLTGEDKSIRKKRMLPLMTPQASPSLSGNNNRNQTQCPCEKTDSLYIDSRLSRSFHRRHSLNDPSNVNGSVPSQFPLNPHRISSFKQRTSNMPSPRLFKQIQFKEVNEIKGSTCDHNLELVPLIT